jgi:hypothetical protein
MLNRFQTLLSKFIVRCYTAASGSNETVPIVTASSEEGSDSPAVDLDAAKIASITAEINVVGARLTGAFDSLLGVEAVVGDAGGNPAAYNQRVAEYWKAMLVVVGRCKLKRVESRVESAWFERLKLRYDKLLSSFAFNFNLRRYNAAADWLDALESAPPAG